MMHYICRECDGEAEKMGKCQTDGCPQFGKSLEPCECIDGMHKGEKETEVDGMDEVNENDM